MISEPKNFEHLIHTETEAEAEQIFKEWIRNPSAGKLPGECGKQRDARSHRVSTDPD